MIYGGSSTDCNQNFNANVETLLEQLGINNLQVNVHFTQNEYETLEAVIEGEKEVTQKFLTEGYLKRKQILAPSEDMYDNYRLKVIALMREIGIPDEKMLGLPLHFNRAEHDGIKALIAGQAYESSLDLIRGFISHKVQINSEDVCIANNLMDARKSLPQQPNSNFEKWKDRQLIQVTPVNNDTSLYFKLFPKIKKIW
tara:strand:+ start:468 stop:1061 length:594 start_codon:yes stop_codon:yes gene_type:complete